MQSSPLKKISYTGKVYRNIFVCPGQDLYDDIGDPEDFALIDLVVQASSGIDHQLPQFHRPFQYGDLDHELLAVFKRENWRAGRFGDGHTYGVWYGAEEALTSIYEAAYWTYRLGKDNVLTQGEVYSNDRTMYEAAIQSQAAIDLHDAAAQQKQLVDPIDYSFCQNLGEALLTQQIEVLRSPSARKVGGICTPLFSPKPIQQAQIIYYLKLHANPDGWINVHSSKEAMNFSIAFERLENPYGLKSGD